MNKYLLNSIGFFFFVIFSITQSLAQKGKDGALTISGNNTAFNVGTTLSANAAAGVTSINVSNNPGIGAGDLVLIIQMQGATIKNVQDNTWGEITNYNSSGLNEFAEVASLSGNTIHFACALKNSYSIAGKVQVIKVPRYTSLTLNSGVSLSSGAWNGTSGGIVAMEVSGDVVLNGTINVSAKGFRGGAIDNQSSNPVSPIFWASPNAPDGGEKGEGIAGANTDYDMLFGGRHAQGAPANGGGGGSSHNAGGGGGANGGAVGAWTGNGNPDASTANWTTAWNLEGAGFATSTSSGGGRGGYSFAYAPEPTNDITGKPSPVDVLTVAPGNAAWSGDLRRNIGGRGGRPLDYSGGRLFFGGGGGAGDGNDGISARGGNGGGLVYILACGNISGSGQILANGETGADARISGGNDAPGGGGAGGTVVLNAKGTISGTLSISANGGKGGDQELHIVNQWEGEGPGGGGGGGVVLLSGGTLTTSLNGGINGVTDAPLVAKFRPNGATRGGAGTVGTIALNAPPTLTAANKTICAGSTATLTAVLTGGTGQTITWYADSMGLRIRHVGATWTTPALFADTIYYVGNNCSGLCGTSQLIPDTVFVRPVLADAGRDTAFCSGGSAQIGKPATVGYTYSWTPIIGLSSSTISNPVVTRTNTTTDSITTKYVLTVTSGTCIAKDSVLITVYPVPPSEAGTDTTFCSGGSKVMGTASIPGYTYSWTPSTGLSSSTISNPTVTRTNISDVNVTTRYIVTTSFKICRSKDSINITVLPIPISNAGPDRRFCSGNTAQLGVNSTQGYLYSWTPATGLTSSTVSNPKVTLFNTTNDSITTTYVVTTTLALCSTTDTVKVTVSPIPPSNAGSDTSFCSGGSAQLGSAGTSGYVYSWSPGNGLSSTTISNPTVTRTNVNLANIKTTYILTTIIGSCITTDTVAVIVRPIPISNAGTDSSFCPGGSKILGTKPTAGYTYLWSPATGLNSTTSANPTVTLFNSTTANITTRYYVTTTANNCSSIDSTDITVKPIPVSNAGTDTSFCSGGSKVLGTAPLSDYAYLWSPATSLDNPDISNPTVTRTNTVNDIVTTKYIVRTTGTNGCTSTDTAEVSIRPIPVSNAGSDSAFCSGGNKVLGTTPTTRYVYAWTPATGLSSTTASNPTATLTNTTSASTSITYTVTTTAYNCVSSDVVTLTVKPNPVADAGSDSSFCSGGNALIGTSTSNAGYTYLWTPTRGLSSSTMANPRVTLTNTIGAPLSTNYIVTTTLNNCSTNDTVTITINPYPVAKAGTDRTYCSGGTANLGEAGSIGTTYQWNPATGLSDPQIPNPSVTLSNPGGTVLTSNYVVTVTSYGCVTKDSVMVIVKPFPVSNAGLNDTICSGSSANIGTTSTSGYTYSWSPVTGLGTGSTSPNPKVTLTNYTSAQVTKKYVVTTTLNLCSTKDSVEITVGPGPLSDAGTDKNFCSGSNATLGSANNPIYTYSWTPATDLSSPTVSNPTVTKTNTGNTPLTTTYIVTTSAFNCISQDTVDVTVNPYPVSNAGVDTGFCSGSSSSKIGTSATPGYAYTWMPTTGLGSNTVSDPTINLTNTSNTPVTVKYIVTTLFFGCETKDSVNVTVRPTPASIAGGPFPDYCFSINAKLGTGTAPPNTGNTYSWSPGTYLNDPASGNPTVNITNTGTQPVVVDYTVTTTANGCSSSAPVTIKVYPKVIMSISPPVEMCQGSSATLTATGGNQYFWSNDAATTPSITVSPATSTKYLVIARNEACSAMDSVSVTIKNAFPITLYIPNAMTPNGDGDNELFAAKSSDSIDEFKGMIYNRWGELYYEWNSLSGGWDGTYQGAVVQEDVYVYEIKVKNECSEEFASRIGTVTVIR